MQPARRSIPPPTTRAPIFTSQNLTNSANSLSSLLDQIGQGLQTINAATNGLQGITSLLQQALSTVQQAQSAPFSTAGVTTGAVDLSTAGAPSAAAGSLLLSVGTTTATITISSGEALSAIKSAINSASTTTLDGAVAANRQWQRRPGSELHLDHFHNCQQRHLDRARPHHRSSLRHQHNADVAPEQLQHTADADQSAGRDSGYNGVNLIGVSSVL